MKRFVTMLFAVGAVAGCAVEQGAAQSEEDTGQATSAVVTGLGARVQIRSMVNTAGAGKCLDVASGQTAPGTAIVQFRCHRALNQQFFLDQVTLGGAFQIVSKLDTTKCVGVDPSIMTAVDHTLVRLEPCRDASGLAPLGTRFFLDSNDLRSSVSHIAFRSALTSANPRGTCIDVASGLAIDSLWMQLYGCHGGANQQWEVSNW
jgi:hypothetical protein